MCHMWHVMCHDKWHNDVVKLVGGGFAVKGATPSSSHSHALFYHDIVYVSLNFSVYWKKLCNHDRIIFSLLPFRDSEHDALCWCVSLMLLLLDTENHTSYTCQLCLTIFLSTVSWTISKFWPFFWVISICSTKSYKIYSISITWTRSFAHMVGSL